MSIQNKNYAILDSFEKENPGAVITHYTGRGSTRQNWDGTYGAYSQNILKAYDPQTGKMVAIKGIQHNEAYSEDDPGFHTETFGVDASAWLASKGM